MSDFSETKAISNELACSNCGAILKYKAGTSSLSCDYCGTENEIPKTETGVKENDLEEYLAKAFDLEEKIEVTAVKCNSCGATSTLPAGISSDKCPFCAANLVVKSGSTAMIHKPQGVLPFGIDEIKAQDHFKKWLKSLWFAPDDLVKYGSSNDKLSGMYLPYWTFDCRTNSSYTGERGDYYYTTESYTAQENGKSVTRTRQVRHTRWSSTFGNVSNTFDDLLIEATRSLPQEKLRSLEPWDTKNVVSYNDKYLSGFRTETYTVDLRTGYQEGKNRMEPIIRATICSDIGGDEQRIHSVDTSYHNPTFKHILMPVYLSVYRYNSKVYQFLVNARTGEVQGERPWSAVKIAFAIIMGLIAIAVIAMFAGGS